MMHKTKAMELLLFRNVSHNNVKKVLRLQLAKTYKAKAKPLNIPDSPSSWMDPQLIDPGQDFTTRS